MSATRRVLEVNRRRYRARDRLMPLVQHLGLAVWRNILALERAAFDCGVERERRRHADEQKGMRRR